MRLAGVLLMVLLTGCYESGRDRSSDAGVVRVWGGPGRSRGRFHRPRVIDAFGDTLYVIDMSGRIQLFDLDGGWRASWQLPQTHRGYPTGMAVAADGRVAVADTHNYVVRIYDAQGRQTKVIGGEGGEPGRFTYLTDVAFDAEGNMFVSEHGREDRIQKFDPDGRFLLGWGGSGEEPGRFHRPQALVVDGRGCVTVADAANHRIQKFTGDGKPLAVWGGAGREPGRLLYPYDVDLTPEGYLVVCEYGNNRIQVFDGDGHSVAVMGGPGREPGRLAMPWAVVCVSGRGVYVADCGNHRVQLFAVPSRLGEN